MIAVEKFGSNFMGALSYNLKKLHHPDKAIRAQLLAMSFSSLSPAMIKKEVALIKSLRPALKKHVWHTSLNFSIEEQSSNLTNERLLEIGLEYMKAMGYDDNQYLIVRHHDAEHPHIHLLVNRIRYDGSVVSDSNNFKRSQAVLRLLEQHYNLISLDQHNCVTIVSKEPYNTISEKQDSSITAELGNYRSIEQPDGRSIDQDNDVTSGRYNPVSPNKDIYVTVEQYNNRSTDQSTRTTKRSLTKNEIEKTLRTRIPSDKSLLQVLLEPIIYERRLTLQEFIISCDQVGISLLFNQTSTGRVSGITYFINDFKTKGQSLGNRFKWAELIKHIEYEQDRDSKAISAANDSAKAKYGKLGEQSTDQQYQPGGRLAVTYTNAGADAKERDSERQISPGDVGQSKNNRSAGSPIGTENSKPSEIFEQNEERNDRSNDNSYSDIDLYSYPGIEIVDDVDDEAVHGRNRHKQRKTRTNRR